MIVTSRCISISERAMFDPTLPPPATMTYIRLVACGTGSLAGANGVE